MTFKTKTLEYFFILLVFFSLSIGNMYEIPLLYSGILCLFLYYFFSKKMLVSNLLLLLFLLLLFIFQISASYVNEEIKIDALSYLIISFPIFISIAIGVLFANKINLNETIRANNTLTRIIYLDWLVWNVITILPLEFNILLYEGTFKYTCLLLGFESLLNIVLLFKIWTNINKNVKWVYYVLPIFIILQTFQRAAIISLILVLIFSNIKWIYKMLSVFLFLFFAIFSRVIVMEHSTSDQQFNSIAHRVVFIGYAYQGIQQSFPYGVGLGNSSAKISTLSSESFTEMIEDIPFFTDNFKRLIYTQNISQQWYWVQRGDRSGLHNTFFNLILDYGAFGLFLVLFTVAPLFFIFFRRPLAMEVRILYSLMPIYFFISNYAFIAFLMVLSTRSYKKYFVNHKKTIYLPLLKINK